MIQNCNLRLYQLAGVILSAGSQDNAVFRQLLDVICEALEVNTAGLFIWDDEIKLYYPLVLNGHESARVKSCFDKYAAGETCNVPLTVFDIAREHSGPSVAFGTGCQFIVIYSGEQCLGMIGIWSDRESRTYNSAEFIAAVAHCLTCVRMQRTNRALNLKSRELAKMRDRLEQVLRNNMDKQVLIEKMAADLKLEAEKANRANQAKSEFLSSMSHELRTPLNAILGFAQLLELDELSDDQQENLSHIINSGNYLLALINELLDLAKIESGKLVVENQYFSVRELIINCVDSVRTLAQKHRVNIVDTAVMSDCPEIYSDPMRVRQVLLNLLSNAIKYNRPQGEVKIDCERSRPGFLRIKVTDTGIGLSEEQTAVVFEVFERLSFDRSAVEGTGIGLNISKLLVQRLGGTIGVKSELDVGSCFWIELPLSPPSDIELLH